MRFLITYKEMYFILSRMRTLLSAAAENRPSVSSVYSSLYTSPNTSKPPAGSSNEISSYKIKYKLENGGDCCGLGKSRPEAVAQKGILLNINTSSVYTPSANNTYKSSSAAISTPGTNTATSRAEMPIPVNASTAAISSLLFTPTSATTTTTTTHVSSKPQKQQHLYSSAMPTNTLHLSSATIKTGPIVDRIKFNSQPSSSSSPTSTTSTNNCQTSFMFTNYSRANPSNVN
jgi:hypothetical protein